MRAIPDATDPAYAEPAVRRRYVDFLRICGLLCPA
jgi:hypothetical protein